MKTRIKGFQFGEGRQKSGPIIERALQLKDDTLTQLMVDAGWIEPFEVTIDTDDPASMKRAKLMGFDVRVPGDEL